MAEEIFENLFDLTKGTMNEINEADSLGKGPGKTPEMKGASPDLANVNEEEMEDLPVDAPEEEVTEEMDREIFDKLEKVVTPALMDGVLEAVIKIANEVNSRHEITPEDLLEYLVGHIKSTLRIKKDTEDEELPTEEEEEETVD